MEEDFYATIKFKTGEEVFARVAASAEEDRTMLIVSNPVTIDQIKSRAGIDILFGDNDIPKIGPILDPKKEQERIDKLLGN